MGCESGRAPRHLLRNRCRIVTSRLFSLVGILLVLPKPVQAAADATVPIAHRSLAVEAHAALGAPIGLGGVSLDVGPVDFLSLSGGVGLNFDGLQYSLMARVRIALGRAMHDLGVGVAAGRYRHVKTVGFFENEDVGVWDRAYSGQIEYSQEWRLAPRLIVRPYLGVSEILNDDAYVCTGGSSQCSSFRDGTWFPYIGVGFAFFRL